MIQFPGFAKILIIALVLTKVSVSAQLPVGYVETSPSVRSENLVRKFLTPTRIIWTSDSSGKSILNQEVLLKPGTGQTVLNKDKDFILKSTAIVFPMIILDFGKEIQGGLEIVTAINNEIKMGKVRIRFGESVSETMSNVGEKGATNDHAMRDFIVALPWLGRIEVGNSGFRFVSIQLIDPNVKLEIKEVNAIFTFRDIPYLGSFKCNDERLNKIWMTGAYTVHLNMQDYLWDGIKRDRLVWVGDLHPEVSLRKDAALLAKNCFLMDEFLVREKELGRINMDLFSEEAKTIKLHCHCQQKSIASSQSTLSMLSFPKNYHVSEIPSGCCGMAGSFGYEKEHYEISMKIGELVLFRQIENAPLDTIISAQGTSCRHQINDFTNRIALHPVEILYGALKP